jgi:hypothetical protein
MTRTVRLDLPSAAIQLISLEDLTARTARLVLDLAEGIPVLSKHARDFWGLVNLVDKAEVETAWQDHRKPNHPMTFQETISLLDYLIPTHQDLLVTAKYSKDTEGVCPRCSPTPTFQLANPNVILSLFRICSSGDGFQIWMVKEHRKPGGFVTVPKRRNSFFSGAIGSEA